MDRNNKLYRDGIKKKAKSILFINERRRLEIIKRIAALREKKNRISVDDASDWFSFEMQLANLNLETESVFKAFISVGIFTHGEADECLADIRKEIGLSEDGKELADDKLNEKEGKCNGEGEVANS